MSKREAEERVKEMQEAKSYEYPLDSFYLKLRRDILQTYNNIDNIVNRPTKYEIDVEFGLSLYEKLKNDYNFSLREASNDGIWRYISVVLMPEINVRRFSSFGEESMDFKIDHLYSQTRRIYPKSIWWYIHLSWQGDRESTKHILKNNTTDEIMNLVERSGSGYRVDVYREIMKHFSTISTEKRGRNLFRKVLKLNTAKVRTVEPELFENGVEGYVNYLFNYFMKEE